MSKKMYSLSINGAQKCWGIIVYAEPTHVNDWRADGLELEEIVNTIPMWLPACLMRPWCVAQDLFNFKNPFKAE